MKIDLNRLDGLNARMTIVIEYADYYPKLDENIKNYSKKLAIKGFRAGKTPKSVLTKMYGKGMLEETINNLLNEKLFGYLEEQNIGFFGSPLMAEDAEPIDFNAKTQADYTFVFDLGLKPDFELKYNHEDAIEALVPTVDQAGLDEDIIRYRRVFGEEVPVAGGDVQKHDRVKIKLQPIQADGTAAESDTETVIDLDRIQGEAATQLLGLTDGATLEADLEKFLGYERSVILKNTLHLEEDLMPDQPLNYLVTILSINRPQQTALTGDQLTKFTGKSMEGEEEFRQFLEKREKDNLEGQANDMKKMLVRSTLIKGNPFDIPEAFLLKWVNQQRDKKIDAGSKEATDLYRDAKWSLLLNKIATAEGLEVTEKDIQRQVTNWVIQNVNYMQTDVKKLMEQLYANEYFMSTMKESALEEVVFGNMIPRYQFAEREVTMEAFEKAFHDLQHTLFDHGDHDHPHHHEHSHDHSEHSHG